MLNRVLKLLNTNNHPILNPNDKKILSSRNIEIALNGFHFDRNRINIFNMVEYAIYYKTKQEAIV